MRLPVLTVIVIIIILFEMPPCMAVWAQKTKFGIHLRNTKWSLRTKMMMKVNVVDDNDEAKNIKPKTVK